MKMMFRKALLVVMMGGAMIAFNACESATKKIKNSNPEKKEVKNETPATPTNNTKNNQIGLDAVDGDKLPVFSFDRESHDLGTLEQGEQPSTTFEFTNIGDGPLIITSAKGSCGCTVPKWPNEPIAPGETGEINVSFNSTGRSGIQTKTVTIVANTVPNTKVLTITSEVVVP